ncbi:hypothetical protein DFH27DRAFT_576102 [Peziza echinospora]|nr:hypothetical protein DFH27DRAFT_576102 [Peziza echinospora]
MKMTIALMMLPLVMLIDFTAGQPTLSDGPARSGSIGARTRAQLMIMIIGLLAQHVEIRVYHSTVASSSTLQLVLYNLYVGHGVIRALMHSDIDPQIII